MVFGGGDNPDIVTPQAELIAAMDSLAPQVLLDVRIRKLLRSGRRLESIQLSTSIDEINEVGKSEKGIETLVHALVWNLTL